MSIYSTLSKIYSPLKKYIPEKMERVLKITLLTAMQGLSRRRGYKDLILSSYSALLKSDRVLGRPVYLTIEPTNICDLQCPVCETGAGILKRAKGSMSFDNYKIIIDKLGEHTNSLLFYFMGEPFLNKSAYDMISYAAKKGIFVSTCTNGHFVDAKAIIESGIGEVSFQIGGMTQKTHETYRVRGDLRKTLDNLAATVEEKRKHPQSKTKIIAGFIVMKHNEHEVADFLKFAREIGVDGANVDSPCVRTIEQGKQFLPQNDKYWLYDRKAFDKGILRPSPVLHNHCEWLYYSTTIQWNGDVVPCCRDAQGDYIMGNIFGQDFYEIWNGEKFREFRRKVNTDQANLELCRLCSGYGIPLLQ
jgi:radical SAM protein with 4Fe4S-binding SPASM domain